MKKTVFFLSVLIMGSSAFASEMGDEAQYLWTRESQVQSAARAQIGVGLLDRVLTGSRGAVFINTIGFDFAASPDFQLSLSLPMAGTASSGSDDFGIGNITVGGKYVVPIDRLRFGLGMDVALPSAQNAAAVGTFGRSFTQFIHKQTAISPYAFVSFVGEKLTVTADVQNDIQIFSDTTPIQDKMEDVISYDFAFAHAFYDHVWATVEFGGYSTVSYGSANTTQLFAGPGIRYQDKEVSVGFHFWAPFKSPSKDIIDFTCAFDVRVPF